MPRKRSDSEETEAQKQEAYSEIQKKLFYVQNKQDQINDSLEKLQAFVEKEPNVETNQKQKIKRINLHSNLLKLSESQVEYLRKLLADIEKVQTLEYLTKAKNQIKRQDLMDLFHRQGKLLPLWVNNDDGFPGEYVGAISPPETSKLCCGDLVAAFDRKNWILAEIVSAHSPTKYDCKDVEDESKPVFRIPRHRIIPLPKWRANPKYDKHALFPVGALVLALYPQTSCFYPGVVHSPPSTAVDDYAICFEDASSNETTYLPPMMTCQKFVLPFRKMNKSKKKEEEQEPKKAEKKNNKNV